MRAEAIVIDATFLEDATITNVGLPAGCGIIFRRSVVDNSSAKRLVSHDLVRAFWAEHQQAI
jgi:hypothetical protein